MHSLASWVDDYCCALPTHPWQHSHRQRRICASRNRFRRARCIHLVVRSPKEGHQEGNLLVDFKRDRRKLLLNTTLYWHWTDRQNNRFDGFFVNGSEIGGSLVSIQLNSTSHARTNKNPRWKGYYLGDWLCPWQQRSSHSCSCFGRN